MAGDGEKDSSDAVVADAARRLYAVPLTDFVASRKALAAAAKAEGDPAAAKEILTLRKPTLTAWAMNLVPRSDCAALADLVGLGARMRAAQSRLDTSTLTSVRGERDAALAAYVEAVADAAGDEGATLSASARDEVRASAIAALADETAAQALASGQLTRALNYSGFGEVDLSGAVGVTSSGSVMSVLPGGGQGSVPGPGADTSADEDAGEETRAPADADGGAGADPDDDEELTPDELARAVAEAKAAKAQARARAEERRRAEDELGAAQAQMRESQAALDEAEQVARTARRAVVDAQTRLDAARDALTGLPDADA